MPYEVTRWLRHIPKKTASITHRRIDSATSCKVYGINQLFRDRDSLERSQRVRSRDHAYLSTLYNVPEESPDDRRNPPSKTRGLYVYICEKNRCVSLCVYAYQQHSSGFLYLLLVTMTRREGTFKDNVVYVAIFHRLCDFDDSRIQCEDGLRCRNTFKARRCASAMQRYHRRSEVW